MPIEPPPTRWRFPPVDVADEHGIVAVGGDLEPGTLLAAYRQGLFPMPVGAGDPMAWWSPDPRGVLPVDGLHVSRSLRRSLRRYEVRVDTAFADVVAGCADPARRWLGDPFDGGGLPGAPQLGWAHSVEAWDADGLAGGLYGVAIGGLFAGESMFSRRTDASKVALVALVGILRADGGADRLLDVQWATPHLPAWAWRRCLDRATSRGSSARWRARCPTGGPEARPRGSDPPPGPSSAGAPPPASRRRDPQSPGPPRGISRPRRARARSGSEPVRDESRRSACATRGASRGSTTEAIRSVRSWLASQSSYTERTMATWPASSHPRAAELSASCSDSASSLAPSSHSRVAGSAACSAVWAVRRITQATHRSI